MTVILETLALGKMFGALIAVQDMDVQIEQGSMHSIIGPNGAGKTTFFNLLTGKFKPSSGRIMYNGEDITNLPMHARIHIGIGRSFQITNIFPNLTVLENVRLAAQATSEVNFRWFRQAGYFKEFERRALEVLEQVDLRDMALLPANVLPHGGKRKLELAILLAPDPQVLLLDEPTAGMASEQVPQLINTINQIRLNGNKTIVMVEHNMSVVMGVSDRITVMNLGRKLAEGTPSEIAQNETVQRVYLGDLYGDLTDMIGGGNA